MPGHVAIVGAGLMGLATARELAARGHRVTVLDQFPRGHTRGSSHSRIRISRLAYGRPVFAELMRAAAARDWPRLERDAETPLLHPRPGCFFGPPGDLYREFAEAMAAYPGQVEALSPGEAGRRFPRFRFEGMAGALLDSTAAVIDAEATLDALRRLAVASGAVLRESHVVMDIDADGDGLSLATAGGALRADRIVVTAGAWAASLVPALVPRLTVLRQTVGHYRIPAHPVDGFPVFAYLGAPNDFYYGLPDLHRGTLKVARHVVSGPADDPDHDPGPSTEALEDLDRFLDRRISGRGERVEAETCLYTATATEDFILDVHPHDPRIVIGAGFTGHGFKFGPIIGRILADLVEDAPDPEPVFERWRDRFRIVGPGPR